LSQQFDAGMKIASKNVMQGRKSFISHRAKTVRNCQLHRRKGCDRHSEENVMRTIFLAITTVLTVGFATAALTSGFATPASAAAKGARSKMAAMMAEMKAKDPQSYAACLDLARQRGYTAQEVTSRESSENMSANAYRFLEGCMMGKQH